MVDVAVTKTAFTAAEPTPANPVCRHAGAMSHTLEPSTRAGGSVTGVVSATHSGLKAMPAAAQYR